MIETKIDAAVKKIKISKFDLSDKCLQRKQKYTMRVKNWLADVDPPRFLEEEAAEVESGCALASATQVGENKNAANVIQSRLANCGGVMKFGIPKM